jgi:hypothetical protein
LAIENATLRKEWAERVAESRPVKVAQSNGYALDEKLAPLRRLLVPTAEEDEEVGVSGLLGAGAGTGAPVATLSPADVKVGRSRNT